MRKKQNSFLVTTILLTTSILLTTPIYAQPNVKVGIGVRLELDSTQGYKTPRIVALVPNGSAQEAGLQEGDIIMKVNDVNTRNLVLQDVVNMIVGKEGTEVKLLIERKGSTHNYNIVRGKYKFSDSYYKPAVQDNAFCTALSKLMNDAAYNFVNTIDTLHPVDKNGYYISKVKIPGVESVGMDKSWGVSGQISIGDFKEAYEVSIAGTKIIENIKTCYPGYYYEPFVDKDGTVSVNIGAVDAKGYESPTLLLYSVYDKTKQMFNLRLGISSGKADKFFTIPTVAGTNNFATSLKTIYKDISNNFENVKGARHEIKGDLFRPASAWYELNTVPEGAISCSISEGSMGSGAACNCRFYSGSNLKEAADFYKNMIDKTRNAVGSEFVYSFDQSKWDTNIPANAKSALTFGIKKKHTFESDLQRIVLVFLKNNDNTFAVDMLFYNFGF